MDTEQDAYTYFERLVAEGDLEKVIAHVNRFRLGKQSMRATAGSIKNAERPTSYCCLWLAS